MASPPPCCDQPCYAVPIWADPTYPYRISWDPAQQLAFCPCGAGDPSCPDSCTNAADQVDLAIGQCQAVAQRLGVDPALACPIDVTFQCGLPNRPPHGPVCAVNQRDFVAGDFTGTVLGFPFTLGAFNCGYFPLCPDGSLPLTGGICPTAKLPPPKCRPNEIVTFVNGVLVCQTDPPVPSHLPRHLRRAFRSSVSSVAKNTSSLSRTNISSSSNPRLKQSLNPTLKIPAPVHFKSCDCGHEGEELGMVSELG